MPTKREEQSDHDTLIQIKTLVETLGAKVEILSNGTHQNLVDHEKRIRSIEDMILQIQPNEKIARYEQTTQWVNEFKSRLTVYVGLFSLIVAVISSAVGDYIKQIIHNVVR